MSKIHTTLHKKGDNTINVYPNIESENIPSASITGDKLASGSVGSSQLVANAVSSAKIANNAVTASKIASNAVTNTKIEDGAVTTTKLANGAVSNAKLASNSVSTSSIADSAVVYNKLGTDVKSLFDKINRTYGLFVGLYGYYGGAYFGNTTLSSLWDNYTDTEIQNAFDFDKGVSDFTATDLDILKIIIDGIVVNYPLFMSEDAIQYDSFAVTIDKASNTSYQIKVFENNTLQYALEFNPVDHTVTSVTNNKELKLTLKKSFNFDVM